MEWIKTARAPMRGQIESTPEFVHRNVQWWRDNRGTEATQREPCYRMFLDRAKLPPTEDMIVGEVGPGPFGGIIEVCQLPARRKVFIDYIMRELYDLRFISWPTDALYVDTPAEDIPLECNAIDVLVSYNTLDHGWDIFSALYECVRVSRLCFLAFDCRADDENEVAIRGGGRDKDHYQLLHYESIREFLDREISSLATWSLRDLKLKGFPVALVRTEKK